MLKNMKTLENVWALRKNKKLSPDSGLRTITMCKRCYTFYYHHSWHFEMPAELQGLDKNDNVAVRFKECPACLGEEAARLEIEDASDLALGAI